MHVRMMKSLFFSTDAFCLKGPLAPDQNASLRIPSLDPKDAFQKALPASVTVNKPGHQLCKALLEEGDYTKLTACPDLAGSVHGKLLKHSESRETAPLNTPAPLDDKMQKQIERMQEFIRSQWGDEPCDHPSIEREFYLDDLIRGKFCLMCGRSLSP